MPPPNDKQGAPARRERSRDIALALVKERGRVTTGDVKRALQAAGLPSGLNVVKRAVAAAEATGEAVVEKNSIGHVRYLSLPGREKAPMVPAEGGVVDWVAQVLARYEREPWERRRPGWAAWSHVLLVAGRHKERVLPLVEAAEADGSLQTVRRGGQGRRLWARPTPPHWRRFRSALKAVRWLLELGARGDQVAVRNYLAPTVTRPRQLTQPGAGYLPLVYVQDLAPNALKSPGDQPTARRRVRRALKMLRGAGLAEMTKHDGLTWVRALAGQPVAASSHAGVKTPTPPAQPAHEPFRPELMCEVEDLVIAEAARRFGPAALPAWML